MSSIMNKLQQFDAYTKPLDDFRVRTWSGGAVTIVSGVLIVLLVLSELHTYLSVRTVEELYVDSSSVEDEQRIDIHFDIRFHAMPCDLLTVDVMDISGAHQSDISDSIYKSTLDMHGKVVDEAKRIVVNQNATTLKPKEELATTTEKCASCYGAEGPQFKCCPTCESVKLAYREKGWGLPDIGSVKQCAGVSDDWSKAVSGMGKRGCRIHGSVNVAKVAGNFHIAPGESLKEYHSHVHDLHNISPQKFNSTHRFEHFSFGDAYPNKEYPLDGVTTVSLQGGTMHQYYVQVVPTMYVNVDEEQQSTHQFSVTRQKKTIRQGMGDGLPGIFVQYDFSPLLVKYTEVQVPLSQFLVSLCAIVGGVFTVAGLVDACIYNGHRMMKGSKSS